MTIREFFCEFLRWRKQNPFKAVFILFSALFLVWLIYRAFFVAPTDIEPVTFLSFLMLAGSVSWVAEVVFSGLDRFAISSDRSEQLRKQEKQRIKILTRFLPPNLVKNVEVILDQSSIYKSFVEMLKYASSLNVNRDESEVPKVRLLLCSPALDYPGRGKVNLLNPVKDWTSEDYWGKEFSKKLHSLAEKNAEELVDLEVTYLEDRSGAGLHPLDDFLQVLASYCEMKPGHSNQFDAIYSHIQAATELITNQIEKKLNPLGKIRRISNIPFQIALVLSEQHSEVIVSFAGHEILEDLTLGEPAGFFSTDRHVVKTFLNIYNEYVGKHRRKPFIPRHTKSVIEKQSQELTTYELPNFMGLGLNLAVHPQVFSPYYGNSTKFTCWILTKILSNQKTVLDIGSGTGVLALVAYKSLTGTGTPNIVAVEAAPAAFENLVENVRNNVDGIQCIRAALAVKTNKEHTPRLAWKLLTKEESQQIPSEVLLTGDTYSDGDSIIDGLICEVDKTGELIKGCSELYKSEKFDVVIADLPFVDACSSDQKDRAFLDIGHREHETLFAGVKNGKWLKKDGLLITALSSLGGIADVHLFEQLVARYGLAVQQKHEFQEADYMWIVYILVHKEVLDKQDYWLHEFGIKKTHAVQDAVSGNA